MAGTRGKKRSRPETEEEGVPEEIEPTTAADEVTVAEPSFENKNASNDIDGDNEDDAPLVSNYKMSRAVYNGHECPYLDSISRQVCILKTSQISTKFVDCTCSPPLPSPFSFNIFHFIISPSLSPFLLCRTLILISRNAARSLFPTSTYTSASYVANISKVGVLLPTPIHTLLRRDIIFS